MRCDLSLSRVFEGGAWAPCCRGPCENRTMNTRTLIGGIEIPYLGFGTYLIGNDEAGPAVSEAIRAGYRHIDTAEGYRNEPGVGAGIRQASASEGLAREDLFVTTKLWPGNPAWGQEAKTTASTVASLEASLERLGLSHVDLYLIHAPYEREQRLAQWRGLVELQQRGKTRAIGVSNFSRKHIEELRAAGLPLPAANQIELHPWSQSPSWCATSTTTGSPPSPTAVWFPSRPGGPLPGRTAPRPTR